MIKYYFHYFISGLLFSLITIHAYSQCSPQNVRESITNGDFEMGYVAAGPGSFATSQRWLYDPANSAMSTIVDNIKASGTAPNCAWTSEGHFTVDSYYGPFTCSGSNYNGHPFITEGTGRYDHTQGVGGTGKYLMIDGKNGTAADPLGWKLWEQSLSVYPNQMYYFSAWFINLTPVSTGSDRAELRFVVQAYDAANNPIGGPSQLGATTWSPSETSRGNSWEQYYQTYSTPLNAVTLKLSIYNQTSVVNGNDIGVDDISFINGCNNILSLTVPTAPNLGPNQNICATNGSIQLNSNVPVGSSREYSWYTGTGVTQTQIGTTSTAAGADRLTVTSPGTYRVCIYQAGGCAKSSTIVISETASASGSTINYCTADQLTAVVSPSAIEPFMTYSWNKNGSAWAGSLNNKTVTIDGAGTYVFSGVHSNGRSGCNVSRSFNVSASTTTLTSTIGPGPYSLCTPMTQTLTSSLTGTGLTYRWSKNGVELGGNTSSYTATSAGTYRVVVEFNKTGCANITSNDVVINSTNAISPVDAAFCPSKSVSLSVTPTETNVYRWYDSDGTTVVQAPSATSSSFTTPVLAASKTYYVEDSRSNAFTLFTTPTGGNGGNNPIRVDFTVTTPTSLNSVQLQRNNTCCGISQAVLLYNNTTGTQIAASNVVTQAGGSANTVMTATFGGGAGVSLPAGSYSLRLAIDPPAMLLYTSTTTAGSGISNLTATGGRQIFTNWSVGSSTNTCAKVPVRAIADCTLPVDFINVIATASSEGNHIQWLVANEENVSHYEIEKSIDGIHFETIGSVNATSGSHAKSYTFFDNRAVSTVEYYRIKEVDINGTPSYSIIVSVSNSGGDVLIVSKNPFEESTQVYFISSGNEVNNLRITDSKGALIAEYSVKGAEVLTIGENWASGLYILHARNDRGMKTYKVIKK